MPGKPQQRMHSEPLRQRQKISPEKTLQESLRISKLIFFSNQIYKKTRIDLREFYKVKLPCPS
jgi:hypothetical protein